MVLLQLAPGKYYSTLVDLKEKEKACAKPYHRIVFETFICSSWYHVPLPLCIVRLDLLH